MANFGHAIDWARSCHKYFVKYHSVIGLRPMGYNNFCAYRFAYHKKAKALKIWNRCTQKPLRSNMANPSTTLIFMALLCVSAAAAATKNKLYSIENSNVGMCKSLVETQDYTCQEHKVSYQNVSSLSRYFRITSPICDIIDQFCYLLS